jgi:hypothetical protein
MDGLDTEYFVKILQGLDFPREYSSAVVKMWQNLVIFLSGVCITGQKTKQGVVLHQEILQNFQKYSKIILKDTYGLKEVMPFEFFVDFPLFASPYDRFISDKFVPVKCTPKSKATKVLTPQVTKIIYYLYLFR